MVENSQQSTALLVLKRNNRFLEIEMNAEHIRNLVISDPHANLSKITELIEIFDNKTEFPSVRKLALKTLCDIFIDLLPGYKIVTDKNEPTSKYSISKEVKEIRKFEERLLDLYSNFIKLLKKHLNENSRIIKAQYKKEIDRASPNYVILKALIDVSGRLLVAASHFNFSEEIFLIVINICTHLQKYDNLCDNIYASIQELFKTDKTYEGTLRILEEIELHCKTNNIINHKLLDTLHYLNFDNFTLTEPLKDKSTKNHEKKLLSKKGKKKIKREQKDPNIALELNENKEHLQKNRTAILTILFTIYFQILKSSSKSSLILSSSLKGLTLYSHLINIDFYDDLIKLLINLIKNDNLSLQNNLNVLYAIVKLPFFQDCFNVDYAFLYESCYKIIPDIYNESDQFTKFNILIQCLKILLISKFKEASTRRCMSFIKRLFNLMIHLDPSYYPLISDLFRNVYNKFPSIKNLWDNQINVMQTYLPNVDHSEYCNPEGILLWEIPLMSRHYSPQLFTSSMKLIESDKNKI